MLYLFAFVLGFIGRRLVGHGEDDLGNQLTRILCWCLPVGLIVYLSTHVWWFALLSIALALPGIAAGYWGGKYGVKDKKNRNLDNYIVLGIRGAFIATPVAIASYAFAGFGLLEHGIGLWSVIAGLFFAAYYLIGIPLEKRVSLPLLRSYPEWGEGLLCGTILACLPLAF